MWLEKKVFYGRPLKSMFGWSFRIRRDEGTRKLDRLMSFEYAGDMGLDPTVVYNQHRVFRFNTRNNNALSDLVERQALEEYLALIGVDDPEARAVRMRMESDYYEDLDFDHDLDLNDFEDDPSEEPDGDDLSDASFGDEG